MVSIEQLLSEVVRIKKDSEQLSRMTAAAGDNLQEKNNQIAALVRGSASGQEAVMSVSQAARSLKEAAAEMQRLSRICEECAANLAK